MELEKTGIKKQAKGQSDEKAYYRQLLYRFAKASRDGERIKPNGAFCFVLALNESYGVDNTPVTLNSTQVVFGGERSLFSMEVSAISESDEANIYPPGNREFIRLLSDTYVPVSALALVTFNVSEQVFFNNMQTQTRNTKNFYERPRFRKSGNTLLSKGSVLFTSDKEKLGNELKNTAWHKVGFNHFV